MGGEKRFFGGAVSKMMKEYTYINLRQKPELKKEAAAWFHDKWGVPQEAYLECMEAYLNHETEYGWYFCLDGGRIAGGLGVIENDFHDRKTSQTGRYFEPQFFKHFISDPSCRRGVERFSAQKDTGRRVGGSGAGRDSGGAGGAGNRHGRTDRRNAGGQRAGFSGCDDKAGGFRRRGRQAVGGGRLLSGRPRSVDGICCRDGGSGRLQRISGNKRKKPEGKICAGAVFVHGDGDRSVFGQIFVELIPGKGLYKSGKRLLQ